MTFALKVVPAHRWGVTGGNRLEPVNHRLEDPADLRWPKRHDHILFLDVPEAAGSSVSAASLKEMPTHISHVVVPPVLHRSELQLKRRIDLLEAVHIRTGTVLEIALISQRAAAHLPVPADFPQGGEEATPGSMARAVGAMPKATGTEEAPGASFKPTPEVS
eukprot:CAMPEP_0194523556 /NCGR_PEP_ID=MMETSP0253-20130528/58466_1 /TAXON_ID=2966 /ORGANISM="Noctiluca scintillans" /LENGTH=161 /DNA_ID=CAMNT_0039368107 /DNA_START=755 /DNA_END=1241 /DNA_ORIENTATION=-